MKRKIFTPVLALTLALALAGVAQAGQRYRVTVQNLTKGQPFSPPVVAVHNGRSEIFHPGGVAIPELATVAESGNPTDLVAFLSADSNVLDVQVGGSGPYFAPDSMSVEIDVMPPSALLSIVGMLGSTNDAFYGLDSALIAGGPARQVFYLNAWDAGSEGNNESCDYVPGPPCGGGSLRDIDGAEGFIHIHSGIHGIGDLMPSALDWDNPVARVTVERMSN